ncbi:hypothetical protein R0I01_01550 [Bacillus pumilus]|nr:hypothetical protein R0I01_01550 [Bacillus pumilus]
MEAKALDARKAKDYYSEASFDRILIDAPCSGFGVIRRKPDMKYTKSPEDSARLAAIQQAILKEAAPLLKPGGSLYIVHVQWTQTENQQVIHAVYKNTKTSNDLSSNERAALSRLLRLVQNEVYKFLPHYFGTDVSLFAA